MSSGMLGMNVEEVRQLAHQLGGAASEIRQIVSKLTSKLGSTTWVGQDRNQFDNDWNSVHVRNLQNVATALEQAQQAANKNAQDQQTISSSL